MCKSILKIISLSLYLLFACTGPDVGNSLNFPLDEIWSFEAERAFNRHPAVAQNIVFNRTRGPGFFEATYIALNRKSGELEWKQTIKNRFGTLAPYSAMTDERLFVSADNKVMAMNLESGRLEWLFDKRIWNASLAIGNGTLFLGSRGSVVALEPESGKEKWRNTSLPGYDTEIFYNPINGYVTVPLVAHGVVLIDPKSGKITSHSKNNIKCSAYFEPQIYLNKIYCNLDVYDAQTGKFLYDYGNSEGSGFARYRPAATNHTWYPAIDSEIVLLRTNINTVRAVDAETHQTKWEYKPLDKEQENRLLVASNIVTLGSVGYTIASDSTIRAFDVTTGQEIGWWQGPAIPRSTDEKDYFGLASDGEQLYATFGGNVMYAFGPNEE